MSFRHILTEVEDSFDESDISFGELVDWLQDQNDSYEDIFNVFISDLSEEEASELTVFEALLKWARSKGYSVPTDDIKV